MRVDQEDIDRLTEIKEKIEEMANEALEIVRRSGDKFQYNRAKAYWHPHITMALSNEHLYVGEDGATIEDAISSLEAYVVDEDEGEDNEEEYLKDQA